VDDLCRHNWKYRQQPLPLLVCLIDEAWAFDTMQVDRFSLT
jgi:hypothetical protein